MNISTGNLEDRANEEEKQTITWTVVDENDSTNRSGIIDAAVALLEHYKWHR